MTRKTKTLIVALAVLALLGGGYYASIARTKKKADSSSSSYTTTPRLGNLQSSELVTIEVPGIALEKNNDTWELSSFEGKIPPGGFKLDQGQIYMLTYSLASIWTDRVVDEEPEDLSVYGLDNPASWVQVTDSAGKKAEYLLGDMTPSRTSRYIMERGDPKVYTVSTYLAEAMGFTVDSIRQRNLFPQFDFKEVTLFRLEEAGNSPDGRSENRIEIYVMPETIPPHLAATFSGFILTSPYLLPRGVNGETLFNLLSPLNGIVIDEFIDDDPGSYVPYGLDNPARIFLQADDVSLDLLIGNEVSGKRYARLADTPAVFTLSGLEDILNVKPFSLVDKFALLINIDSVDQLLINGEGKNLNAEFQGKGDDGVYFLNGKKTETRSFKLFYQAVIGLLADAEYPRISDPKASGPDPAQSAAEAGVSIEYRLNTPPGGRLSITLTPYNRDFYALNQNGITEFLISRNQVRNIFEMAEKVGFE